mmetsp:Transcript_73363/g.127310  ORF Transcript_73363/g.127310 Transcript_73363/m.127310 type:complete len:91 (+) Transcript_73363:89-361(+)
MVRIRKQNGCKQLFVFLAAGGGQIHSKAWNIILGEDARQDAKQRLFTSEHHNAGLVRIHWLIDEGNCNRTKAKVGVIEAANQETLDVPAR